MSVKQSKKEKEWSIRAKKDFEWREKWNKNPQMIANFVRAIIFQGHIEQDATKARSLNLWG